MKRELINYIKVADFAVSIWLLFNWSHCSVDDFAFNQQNECGNIIVKHNQELYMSWKTWNIMGCPGNSLFSWKVGVLSWNFEFSLCSKTENLNSIDFKTVYLILTTQI